MDKYIYKSKKTGKKVASQVPLDNDDLILVSQVRDGKINKKIVKTK